MSWAACVAPPVMSRVKSLPRCQEGLTEVWVQQGEAKKDAATHDSRVLQKHHSQMHTKCFLPSFSQLPAHLGIWLHSALLNQGFTFPFARKTSSALFFPQTCYPAAFLVPWHSLISTVTAFSKEVSPPLYRCECEVQSTLRDIATEGAFFCFTSSLQSVRLLFLKARGDAKLQRQWAREGARKEEKKGSCGINWMPIACHALLRVSFYLEEATEVDNPDCQKVMEKSAW